MHEAVARLLNRRPGWLFAPEVSFSIYGERGVIDVLGFHPERAALLVIELKTQLVDVQGLIGSVDRYRRLASRIAVPRGWRPRHVSSLVLLRDTQTNRRHVAAHGTVLRAAFPEDGRFMRRWLKAPDTAVDGLGFLSVSLSRNPSAASAGVQRVRRPLASTGRKRPAAGSRTNAPSIPPRNR